MNDKNNGKVLSMDEVEKARIAHVAAPFEGDFIRIFPKSGVSLHAEAETRVSLCGEWEMAESGYTQDRLVSENKWENAVPCPVPCTVHTALFKAGKIPDPTVGRNDKYARENSYKVWWFRKRFRRPALQNPVLRFDGVCYSAMVWLNGKYLGYHKGMFGAFEFDVKEWIEDENTLVVKIDNAPTNSYPYSDEADNDEGWKLGTVINCVYGWHYACIPSRGIWAPVNLVEKAPFLCERPFFVTVDEKTGLIDASLQFEHAVSGKISLCISPKNFQGESVCFEERFAASRQNPVHFRLQIPNVRLWWPNGHGDQNLYEVQTVVKNENGEKICFTDTIGVRKLEMSPTPEGPDPTGYNWQFNVNGKDIFIKGTNWCTTDVLLDFKKSVYERYLTLAKAQGVNFLRAWGGGMPESEDFYDLCDELGLMVFQEWPTGWDSHKIQPLGELLETALQHTVRLRNRASLVLWAGGNESAEADGYAMDEMARISYEKDGSRAFHRSDPCGKGTVHNYWTYWEMRDMDATLSVEGVFMGEYGMASAPVIQSVNRYTPENERNLWAPDEMNAFTYHTPRFNQVMPWGSEKDMKYLSMRVYDFNQGATKEEWIYATQLAQATVLRHPIDKFRANYPMSTGVCYYKMNDVFPACGWSVVDYYGVQKPAYYVVQDAFSPVCAAIVFKSLKLSGNESLPVYFINDTLQEKEVEVVVTAYGGKLEMVKRQSYQPKNSALQTSKLGTFDLTTEQTKNTPLLICVSTYVDGKQEAKTFYWLNFEKNNGCLFNLPKGVLSATVKNQREIVLKNDGEVPIVGLTLESAKDDTRFTCSDNFLFLEAGESKMVLVNDSEGVTCYAWNLAKQSIL